MRKVLITLSYAGLLLSAAQVISQAHVQPGISANHSGEFNFRKNTHVPGTWTAYIEGEKVYIEFTGEDWDSGRSFLLSELGTLPKANKGTFTATRAAGVVTFTGTFAGGKGRGFYKFAEDAAFKSYLEQKGYRDLNSELMLHIFFTDINKGYFDFMKANGYAEISNTQLQDLAQQDLNRKVLEDYFALFKTEGYGHPPLDKIIELREHGVNASFVNIFHKMGYKDIPLDKALELRDHGVNPEFITEMQKIGHKEITLDKAIELRDHGVNPEFISSIEQMGYKDVTLDKAQELRDHGVNPEFIKSISALGFKDLTLDKAQELVDHGVTATFIQKAMDKGVKATTVDDYIRLRDTGFNE